MKCYNTCISASFQSTIWISELLMLWSASHRTLEHSTLILYPLPPSALHSGDITLLCRPYLSEALLLNPFWDLTEPGLYLTVSFWFWPWYSSCSWLFTWACSSLNFCPFAYSAFQWPSCLSTLVHTNTPHSLHDRGATVIYIKMFLLRTARWPSG